MEPQGTRLVRVERGVEARVATATWRGHRLRALARELHLITLGALSRLAAADGGPDEVDHAARSEDEAEQPRLTDRTADRGAEGPGGPTRGGPTRPQGIA